MRVVALEEHFTVPAVASKYGEARRDRQARPLQGGARSRRARPSPMELLPEFGEKRFKSLDDAGITVQVLSNSGPGPDLVPGADGVAMAREINDYLAGVVTKHPKRFAGFATLPMASPDACGDRAPARREGLEVRRSDDPRKLARTVSSIIRATTACLRPPPNSTCRSTSIPTFRCPGHPGDLLLRSAGWLRSHRRHCRLGLASEVAIQTFAGERPEPSTSIRS